MGSPSARAAIPSTSIPRRWATSSPSPVSSHRMGMPSFRATRRGATTSPPVVKRFTRALVMSGTWTVSPDTNTPVSPGPNSPGPSPGAPSSRTKVPSPSKTRTRRACWSAT